jgi:hypothetical protein
MRETAAPPLPRRPEQDPDLKGGLQQKALEGVLLVLADEVPKPSRVNDLDGSSGSDVQQVSIAGDQHVDVRVEKHSQETSRATSSSVK